MKRIIVIIAVLAMVFVNCGFTYDPRAVDYSDVIYELEDEGFTRRGDVWTLEAYDEDNLDWVIIWYDMIANCGVMTIHGYDDDYDCAKRVFISACYNFEWDYDAGEFVINDVREIRR